ncbi:MAG: cardiolipin synthase [Ruminococcaceae bacterium]|nr:cardiolipin synthase [Oscillospiraceae bacterium]
MKLLRQLFSRVVLVSLGIAIQIAWLFLIVFYLSAYYLPVAFALNLLSLAAVVFIINRPGNPQVKMAWIVPILVFPLFGGIIFLISGGKGPKRKLLRALETSGEMLSPYRQGNSDMTDSLELPIPREDMYLMGQCHYLERNGFPAYRDTDAVYYADCKAGWERMLQDLEAAERFIFMEYFILNPGVMWDPVLDILKRKAASGVEVRLIYDDVGSISYVPRKYWRELESCGIRCVAFNPYRPIYAVVMNHRDHRKITVVDGNVGYTGGANFADEYIGEDVRFGEWRDNILRLEGEGVRSMTTLFLEMWNANRPTDTREGAAAYMPNPEASRRVMCPGLVQPYGDSPVDNEILAENVYLNVINQATDYVYIYSPYVVIDYEMSRALSLAARRGVDVRLVVPAVPDKKIVYELTKSYFPELIENGVKVYKFTPGFIHSKAFVADDRQAVVGSVNLDYRSLTLHFENACMFVDHPVIPSVKADFEETFPRCELVTVRKRRFNVLYDLYLGLLRLFAPLL